MSGYVFWCSSCKRDHAGECGAAAPLVKCPAPGSMWTALYKWSFGNDEWKDEERDYEILQIIGDVITYRPSGIRSNINYNLTYDVKLDVWQAWMSPDGVALSGGLGGARMRMVPMV